MAKEDHLIPFEKGKSGNPAGRPKGSLNRSTIARKWLEVQEDAKNPITGSNEKMSQEDIMTLALIKKARKGDTTAYAKLMDSAYGAPMQQTDVTSKGNEIKGTPSVIKFVKKRKD